MDLSADRPVLAGSHTGPAPDQPHALTCGWTSQEFLQDFPHSIVIMLDGRGFDRRPGAGPPLMDDAVLEDLADRLESIGTEFLLVPSTDEVPECLADL